ncbi:3-dehydroquinate synthase [Methyloradius palustris]|uniref:3-dehydroquinate synthase n=1 Tax=Methyloradius palustris TaxID=2778876 RepID=A0A8D5JWN9_9PROT|nr:3-dehydroquinate synthase family protein [Methyloradius palustris]BCM25289.1 3-dehydroquinate synthase [Methyloradius palustris]
MSASFEIHSSSKNYQVEVLTNLLKEKRYRPDQSFVLVDQLVLDLYPYLNAQNLIAITSVEESKSLETVAFVIEQLRAKGANRNSHLIAVGGGIIQDIATFSASVFMRGISWTYYPTTLLAMVDSCVGGKSSINVGKYKNIAGNFYPPENILIETDFCNTLAHAEMIAGLSEAVKICFANQGAAFHEYLRLTETDGLVTKEKLSQVISLSLLTKKNFIEEDEFDQGIRLLLNFGHTFGHAIEAAGHFSITHGVAVGVGMQMALHISTQLESSGCSHPRVQMLSHYLSVLLRGVPSLGKHLSAISGQLLFDKFQSDKKHTTDKYVIIVPDRNGYLERIYINKDDDFEKIFFNSFEKIKGLYEVQ